VNNVFPSEGMIAVKLFVKGVPTIVTLDDFLPFYGSTLWFAQKPSDNDFWVPFIEKAFAKINGNYENIQSGWQAESFRILTGAPSKFYMTSSNTASSAWNTIVGAFNRGWLVGCDTGSSSVDGLPAGHAETVLGAYVIRDTSGNIVAYLYRIRNPWGIDSYNGPWSDNDSNWTPYYES